MVHRLLTPMPERNSRRAAVGSLLLMFASLTSLLVAPKLMPDGYSWLSQTTSESAAQGTEGAWLARLGFLLFGLAVIWLTSALSGLWARGAVWGHILFGAMMLATAAFSHQPWLDGVAFDPVEDVLHSVAATAMGFAFAFGVLARMLQRGAQDPLGRVFDIVALTASIAIPLSLVYLPSFGGLLQRLMFLVAYAWYAAEVLRYLRLEKPPTRGPSVLA